MSHKVDRLAYLQNREISWLKFNERVLDEADYEPRPLLARLRFIAIFTSNLDEFYMVRVGTLTDYMLYEKDYVDNKSGMSAKRQLEEIYNVVKTLYHRRDEMYKSLSTLLSEQSVRHYDITDLTNIELRDLHHHFKKNILPLLSPQIVDMTHPFPHLSNKQLHIAVHLEGKNRKYFGLIPAPPIVERIIPVRNDGFLLTEDVILHFSDDVFNMYKVLEKNVIAVTRNADLSYEDDDKEIQDYRQYMKKAIKKRSRLAPVRLEVQYKAKDSFLEFFQDKLSMAYPQVFHSTSPLDFSFCDNIEKMFSNRSDLLSPSHIPVETIPDKTDMIKLVSKKDIMLSYPYESFAPFLSLMQQASTDDSVVSIKITLYRIALHSKLAHMLIQAVEHGKEVVVLMELRARFDESNNIQWAEHLEQAGCKVLYGIPDYKVHCKVCLITSIHNHNVSYITQFGTGNYNEKTSKQYTDISIITANQEIGADAAKLFNNLLVGNLKDTYTHILAAPSTLKSTILSLMDREIVKAMEERSASIILKCNSVTDIDIIGKLVEASDAGVKIQLIIRGICCIIPRTAHYTENLTVRSIVGTFLEHSRIYCFGTGEEAKIYISSADLMTRNTENRVEIACPVLEKSAHAQIREMLDIMLHDNVKAWEQFSDGRYVLTTPQEGEVVVNSQKYFTENVKMKDLLPGFKTPREKSEDGGKGSPGILSKFKRLISSFYEHRVKSHS
ncbi:MAG: polyphosphate kinase 1 [Deltaproteobacteria bacterium]|jgi:polyphosphate kinase|nr:polyphosphate kinase 1 [Deltaproteobacteria bacterium]